MNVEQYLRRIGLVRKEAPAVSFLATLQQQHLLNIAFENLSIVWNEPILLDLHHLFDKIVKKSRGGFCYELNGMFAWLLHQLGYPVAMLSAGVYNNATGEFGPDFDHMTLLVQLEKPYLVDVGFGDSFRLPIRMPDGTGDDLSGRYRIESAGGNFVLLRWLENRWEPQYRFTSEPRRLSDYQERCAFHQISPESSFTKRTICTIATGTGRITLTHNSFTITEGREKKKIDVNSEEEFQRLLRDNFGIWP